MEEWELALCVELGLLTPRAPGVYALTWAGRTLAGVKTERQNEPVGALLSRLDAELRGGAR